MSTTAPTAPIAFLYIDSDIPEGQTLREWRRDRERTRQEASRRERRRFALLRPRFV